MSAAPSVGRYECLGQLATGGMAEILLGRVSGPSGFERPVVIKRILPHLLSVADYRDMFLDEARIVARIRHDNVVQVHELGTDAGELFLVMEYLEGESVGGLLRRLSANGTPLDPWLACHIVAEACAGLHAAHELGDDHGRPLNLVHRDISPQNIFVTYDGAVKLLDFGIAKVADKSVRTATGQLRGKFQYMSPEQCQGQPLDRRSDIWSLGVVLYELTTLAKPFRRPTELLTFKAICEQPILPPSQVVPEFPAAIEPVIFRATSRDPVLRYATAKEMRADLLSAARELEGTGEARDALAELMQREFEARRREKREMLSRATHGGDLGPLPAAEVDEQVELPAVTEMASAVVASGKPEPRRVNRRGWLAAVAMVVAVGVYAIAALMDHGHRELAQTPAPGAEAAGSATIHVVTRPPGASVVVGGKHLGTSPVTTRLPLGYSGKVVVELDGYERLDHAVNVEQDQTLDLSLRPISTAASAAPPTSSHVRVVRPRSRRRAPPQVAPAGTKPPAKPVSSVEVPVW